MPLPDDLITIMRDLKARVATLERTGRKHVQLIPITTTERDALVATNGIIIYNSTVNKFQGRENGAWVNLI